METERSPLGRSSSAVPRYTFLGGENSSKRTKSWSGCCCCAFLLALVAITLAIVLSYHLISGRADGTPADNGQGLNALLHLQWPLREEKYDEQMGELNDGERAFEFGSKGLKEKDSIEEVIVPVPVDSPAFRHHLATPTTERAREMSRLGYVLNLAAEEMNKRYADVMLRDAKNPKKWVFAQPRKWNDREECRGNVTSKCVSSPYRTADGTCNNLAHPTWGAALRPFRRILVPKYEDGVSSPRRASHNRTLPSAREVSLAIHRPAYGNDVNFTVMLAVWGQFIDHDLTATAISRGKNGSSIRCCQTEGGHPECFPVLLDPHDPFYVRHNVTCMEFVRSAPAPICDFGPREQLNQATSFLDGSVVYGCDENVTNQLRTFTGGELKMLKTPAGDLLPVSDDPGDGCNRKEEFERGRYCFLSGDKRSNENLLLTSMHLLFARQHNLIAKKLAEMNPRWKDEKLFQETRKIIAAEIQHITYNEFLPSILPEKLMTRLNISTGREGYFDSYEPSVDATVANVFASSAFRFGHTLLPGLLRFLHDNSTREEYVELHKMLFDPFELYRMEFLEDVVVGAMNVPSAKSDVHFSQEVTQKLFRKPKDPCGLDLVSLNIQRGRDHGLPTYPRWREICGLPKPQSFDDLRDEVDGEALKKMKELYGSVDDVDLYTGALAERPVTGGLVGPTFSCLIADQFLRLKIGDRYWYEAPEEPQKFTSGQLKEIRKITLAKVICATSGVDRSQPFVMRRVGRNNGVARCQEFSFPDLNAWKET